MFELTAKSSTHAEMLMYGSIGKWDEVRATDVYKALRSAKDQGYEEVKIRMNCPGGSVFEGLAMIGAIQNCGIKVSVAIDGMAASMGSVIVAAVDDVEIGEGARIMIHQGASISIGQSWQLKLDAALLDSINVTISEYYAKKTGKEKQWILDNWMADGKDKWFTAQEAVDAGLVKRKIKGKALPLPKESASYYEIAAHYDQFFNTDKTDKKMNKEELIALLGLKADATDAEIKAAMAANKTKADAADAVAKGTPPPATPPAADTTAADKAQVVEGVVALGKARGMSDEQLASLKTVAGLDVKAAMTMIPEKAADENTSTVSIAQMIADASKGGVGSVNKADRKTWGWDEWEKEPAAFAELLAKQPAEYARIFKAKFNYEPTLAELQGVVFK